MKTAIDTSQFTAFELIFSLFLFFLNTFFFYVFTKGLLCGNEETNSFSLIKNTDVIKEMLLSGHL